MPRLFFASIVVALAGSSCATARSSLAFDDDAERIDGAMAFEAFSPSLPGADGIFLASDAVPLGAPAATSPTPTELRQSPGVLTGGARLGFRFHRAFPARATPCDPSHRLR
jgi:hypothetical protein